MSRRRFNWDAPLCRLMFEPTPYPFWRLSKVIAYAGAFIDRWADFAECVNMQPAHLLRNPPGEAGAPSVFRGLAWRWTDGHDVLCFPRDRHIVVEVNGVVGPILNVYRFEKNGDVAMLVGDARREVLGAQVELDARLSERARMLAAE